MRTSVCAGGLIVNRKEESTCWENRKETCRILLHRNRSFVVDVTRFHRQGWKDVARRERRTEEARRADQRQRPHESVGHLAWRLGRQKLFQEHGKEVLEELEVPDTPEDASTDLAITDAHQRIIVLHLERALQQLHHNRKQELRHLLLVKGQRDARPQCDERVRERMQIRIAHDVRENAAEQGENEGDLVSRQRRQRLDETRHVGSVVVLDRRVRVIAVDLVDSGKRGTEGRHAWLHVGVA